MLTRVAEADAPTTLADLTTATKLPKATVHRLTAVLEEAQLVIKDPLTRRYVVGRRLQDLCFGVVRTGATHAARNRVLRNLSEQLGETVNLGMLSEGQVLYVDRVESAWPLRTNFVPGSRVPVYCTAIGKLLLALAPPRERDLILGALRLQRHTPRTITDRAALLEELQGIRRRGYSQDDEEYLAGVCGIAVPVKDDRGLVVAGLAVAAPSARFPLAQVRRHLPDLLECAEQLTDHVSGAVHPRRQR